MDRSARRLRLRVLGVCLMTLLAGGVTTAVPSSPLLNLPQVRGSTVNLSWSVPFGTSAVRLEAGTAPGLSNAANVVFGATGAYTATDVPAGIYFVRVRAVDGSGESSPSNEVTVIVGGGVPAPGCTAAPSQPTLNPPVVNGNAVTFTWSPAATGCTATGFTLHAGSFPGLSNLAIVNAGGLTSFSATAPNGTYYVRVYGQNAFGSSVPSNERAATVFVAVPTPTPTPTTPIPTTPTPTPTTPQLPASCTNGPYTWDSNPNVLRCRARNGQFALSACCGR